jgi:hypothetical protein
MVWTHRWNYFDNIFACMEDNSEWIEQGQKEYDIMKNGLSL